MNIILASTSPRRADLLRQAHVDFSVLAVEINERILPNELPADYVYRMAQQKTKTAFEHIVNHKQNHQATLILSADTIGVLDGQILTKPKNKDDAFAMWRLMSDKTHDVWTAVSALLIKDGQKIWQSITKTVTKVSFVPITSQMMAYYWATGEPCDKAGGYAIQGFGATWVKAIDGDYSNVVGLPLVDTLALMDTALTFIDKTSTDFV